MSERSERTSRHSGYLDAATAAPLHPVARQALLAALDDGWADPGKLYTQARRARQLLDAARAATAEALGVRDDEVTFCGSGTEATQQAVLGGLAGRQRAGAGLVHSAVEHSAVLYAARAHRSANPDAMVASVPVDRLGRVDLDAFRAAVRAPGVALAALMSANHEAGTVQPVAAAAQACDTAGVPLYVDAAASMGHSPVPPGWSILTASARKWGGPSGIGVLAVRKGVRWEPAGPAGRLTGTGASARAGGLAGAGGARTPEPVNLPAVVAAAASLRAVLADAAAEGERQRSLVNRIREQVPATVPDAVVVGDPEDRLPHIVTFSCPYLDGEILLHELDRYGFAVSSGSACTSETLRPSHVLAAMGVLTHGNVRVSLHRDVGEADVDRFLAVLPEIVTRLRTEAGVNDL